MTTASLDALTALASPLPGLLHAVRNADSLPTNDGPLAFINQLVRLMPLARRGGKANTHPISTEAVN